MNEIIPFSIEQSMLHHLMLKGPFIKESGLFFGKMGIAIAFFDYGKARNNTIFTDFADELIDEVLDNIGDKTGFDFATGLSGIGWGIEYLTQNNYVKCDTNQVCMELDEKLMMISIKRMTDLSIETGLEGILHYILARLKGAANQNNPNPFKPSFIKEIQQAIHTLKTTNSSKNLEMLINNFSQAILAKFDHYQLRAKEFYIKTDANKDILNTELGLRQGLSGMLYKYI